MVGRFSLSSLPSLPGALAELLDTSPQVFYPPSRPASRQSTAPQPPTSSCPPSPRRYSLRLEEDERLPPLPPAPYWSASAHPHTDAPLGHSRSQSTYSLANYTAPSQAFPQSLSHLPPRRSSLYAESAAAATAQQSQQQYTSAPKRPSHKRSQSAAPGAFHAPTLARLEARSSTTASSRQLVSNTSAASLPTLAEDSSSGPSQSLLERSQSDRERRQSHFWLEPAPPATSRGRRRAQSSVTLETTPRSSGTFVEPALPDRLRRHRHSYIISSSAATVALASTPPLMMSNVPTGTSTPMTPRSARSRRGSVSSIVCADGGRASPSIVAVSDIAAQATWSQEPMSPVSQRKSRSNSVVAESPSESLRQRLRSLSELEPRPPVTPTKRHSLILSPATPKSTHGTPGHGHPATPGSCTPTSNSHHSNAPPQSPTPRRFRPLSMHRHSTSVIHMPEERDKPTTSRLRQPAQLHMGPVEMPRSRRQSMLEAPSPNLISTPMLGSSPGSMLSDSGSSPTTSIESLPLHHGLRERPPSEQNREHVRDPRDPRDARDSQYKRTSWHERRRSVQSNYSFYSYSDSKSRHTTATSTSSSNNHAPHVSYNLPHVPAPTYAQAATEWRRPGVAVSVLDDMEGERFLDFDDI